MARPKTDKELRSKQVTLYLTPSDAKFLQDFAQDHEMRGTATVISAIIERLIKGGMSGVTFIKLGWQFATLIEEAHKKNGTQAKLDFMGALRPLPPLIGDQGDPEKDELVPFLEEVKTQIEKEKIA